MGFIRLRFKHLPSALDINMIHPPIPLFSIKKQRKGTLSSIKSNKNVYSSGDTSCL